MTSLSRFALSALALSFALAASPMRAADTPSATIDSGKLRGKSSNDGAIHIFLGIPFAAPPVGPLRWKAPQPVAPWNDVRDATTFGSRCMQPQILKDVVFRDPGQSEDCLTLNIWAPATDAAKLPVMLWIHGGSFLIGGSSEPRYDGEQLARHGVIVITINYRLGVFGFFATSDMAAESPQHSAGNYGYLDQYAAIQWTKRNIAAFGGDPDNITLFGESAGAVAVNAHMASPLSRALIAKAIGESGGGNGKSSVPYPSLAVQTKDDDKFAKNTLHAENLTALRALPADDLLKKASPKLFSHIPVFGPSIDGYFLPDSVSAIYNANKQAQIPLLAGWNADEASFETAAKIPAFGGNNLNLMLMQNFGLHAAEAQKYFHATNNAEAVRAADDLNAILFVVYTGWAWMESHSSSGHPVYRYYFELVPPPSDVSLAGAYHSDELEYVFGTLDTRPGAKWRPEDRRLSEQMQLYWTNFAKNGQPNGTDLPNWPAYGARDSWQVLHLDASVSARPDNQRDRFLFLQKIWTK